MIAYVSGKIAMLGIDWVIIDRQGLGIRIECGQAGRLSLGQDALLHTYFHVREDEMSLYGFLERRDLDLFRKLIGVKGIGPKVAMGMLAYGPIDRLIQAIATSDMNYLKSLPGIGQKSASQILLDLRGKLTAHPQDSEETLTTLPEVESALKELGFRASEIAPVLRQLAKEPQQDVSLLIRKGLQLLQKGG